MLPPQLPPDIILFGLEYEAAERNTRKIGRDLKAAKLCISKTALSDAKYSNERTG